MKLVQRNTNQTNWIITLGQREYVNMKDVYEAWLWDKCYYITSKMVLFYIHCKHLMIYIFFFNYGHYFNTFVFLKYTCTT